MTLKAWAVYLKLFCVLFVFIVTFTVLTVLLQASVLEFEAMKMLIS